MVIFIGFLIFSWESDTLSSTVYLIVQALGSGGVLSCLLLITTSSWAIWYYSCYLFVLLKVGVAPLHGWLLVVLKKLHLDGFFMLTTIQKILPIMLLLSLGQVHWVILIVNILICAYSMLRNYRFQVLLGNVAIARSSWPLLTYARRAAIFYVLAYGVGLSLVVSIVGKLGSRHITLITGGPISLVLVFIFLGHSLRMGGVPPTLGFWAKILILRSCVSFQPILLLRVLLGLSVFILFIYIRFSFSWLRVNFSAPGGIRVTGSAKEILFFCLVLVSPVILFIFSVGVIA